jgi:parvulin-like peptidyl-prolyl isomerase
MSIDCSALLAQGVEPFGEMPDSPFGSALPLGSVRPPMAPVAASRPASWPGGSTLEPENLGGPAVRSAIPITSRVPAAGSGVVRASAIEPVSPLDQEPGFAFAEEKGGPRSKSQQSPPLPPTTVLTTPATTVQATPAVTVPVSPTQTSPATVGVASPSVSQPSTTILNPQRAGTSTPATASSAGTASQQVVAPTTQPNRDATAMVNPYLPPPVPPAATSTAATKESPQAVRPPATSAAGLRNPFQEGMPVEPSPLRERVDNSAGVSRVGDPGYRRPVVGQEGLARNPFAASLPNTQAIAPPSTQILPPGVPPGNVAPPTMTPGAVVRNPTIAPVGEAFISDESPAAPALAQPPVATPAQTPTTVLPAQPSTPAKQPAEAAPSPRRDVSATQAFPFAPPSVSPTTATPSQGTVASAPPARQSVTPETASAFRRDLPATQAFPFAPPSVSPPTATPPPATVVSAAPARQPVTPETTSTSRHDLPSTQAFPFAPPSVSPPTAVAAQGTVAAAQPARQPVTPETTSGFRRDLPSTQAFPFAPPSVSPTTAVAAQGTVAAAQPARQPVTPERTSGFRRDLPSTQAFPFAPPAATPTTSASAPTTAVAAGAATANRYLVQSQSPDVPPASSRLSASVTPSPQTSLQTPSRPASTLLAQAGIPANAMVDSSGRGQATEAAGAVPTSPGVEPGMAPCEGAQILARVGSEIILAADVAGPVNEMIQMNMDKIPPEQIELARRQLTKRFLDSRIETKLAYLDAKRTLPAEALTKVEKNISDAFDREEVEKLMKRAHADSRQELEAKLQSLGSSLELKRQTFIEQALAHQWMRQKIKVDGEVSHEEMRAYYHDHITEFETQAKARWEEIEIRFAKHPNKQEAYALIAQLGNRVLGGAPLGEVARQGSEGITAANGGQRDWANRGSLVSQELDNALFGLPMGELSQIIEDKTAFRIVRVLERKDAVRTPFLEAQVEIRKKIKDQRTEAEMKAFLERLRRQVPVWTVYDDKFGKSNGRG